MNNPHGPSHVAPAVRLLVIGGGTMGSALVAAAVSRGVLAPAEVLVCEPDAARRRDLVDRGVRTAADPGVAGPVPAITLSFLASRTAEPARGALLQAARQLKELMARVAEKQRAVRTASESLLGHMQGLIAQVARSLSPTGTYARPGAPVGAPVAGGLDMTS